MRFSYELTWENYYKIAYIVDVDTISLNKGQDKLYLVIVILPKIISNLLEFPDRIFGLVFHPHLLSSKTNSQV